MDKKKFEEIMEDFKKSLFISKSLETFDITPFDFYTFLKLNKICKERFDELEKINNLYKEEIIAEKAYSGEFSKTILLEMIKANNKKKYTQKIEVETNSISDLTDEEIEIKLREFELSRAGNNELH